MRKSASANLTDAVAMMSEQRTDSPPSRGAVAARKARDAAASTTMVESIEIELPWPPTTGNHQHGKRAGGGAFVRPEVESYRTEVKRALAGRKAPAGGISVSWLLAPPDRRAVDFDNVSKVVADAITRAEFWPDDSNLVIRRGEWVWTDPVPGGLIYLTVLRSEKR
jgi:crossover junction endodeoxyribonuclease RusA